MKDQPNRDLIVNDLGSNIMVEAAAGTGKTTSIVARMVNLIAKGNCRIDNLVATTFTRKASAELRERFYASMRKEANSNRPEIERQRLAEAVTKIDFAFIGTFHSFCRLILRERPIECGVEPGFRDIAELENISIRESSWQIFLKHLYSKSDNRLDRIRELGLKTGQLKQCFNRFIDFPDVHLWPHESPEPIDLEVLKRSVQSYIDDMSKLKPLFPSERGTDKLMSWYERIIRTSNNADWRIVGDFFELVELFDKKNIKTTQKCWHDKNVAKVERDRFEEFRVNVVQPALQWWRQYRYEFVVGLLEQARIIYDQHRRASGGLDFQDLMLRTTMALKSSPDLRRYFQRRFTHILVDEFQDTDPIQAEILAYLTANDIEEQVWQKCTPCPGSLFLVGDPKQSIYRFRRADITIYQQVKETFERSKGQIVPLSTNFRSDEQILEWVNPIFASLFGDEQDKFSPKAVDLEPGKQVVYDGGGERVLVLEIPSEMKRDEAVAFEAEQIARYIHEAITEKHPISRTKAEVKQGKPNHMVAGDFLIITRNRKHLSHYSEALDRYGINNEVSGANAFANIDELKTIRECLQVIDDPKNPIPYVSILRSDLFGFGDADLYSFKVAGGRFDYNSPVPEEMEPGLRERFRKVNESFARYRTWLRNLPFAAAVEKISNHLGLIAKCAIRTDGNVAAGSFLKAIEWLRAQSWDFDSAEDVISYLENILENSESDGCNVMQRQDSCVRVMNLHRAKGLESPVVFLANTYGKNNKLPDFHVDRSEQETRGYLAISERLGEWAKRDIAEPAGWANHQEIESLFETNEEQRLLYVACTRAKSKLIVSLVGGKSAKKSFWQPLYSHLEDVPRIGIDHAGRSAATITCPQPSQTFGELEERVRNAWQSASQSTYNVVAAKQLAMSAGDKRPTWRASGEYGPEWGAAVHQLLDLKFKNPNIDLRRFAEKQIEQFDLGADRISELTATVDSVLKSGLLARVQRAEKYYSEIPIELAGVDSENPSITRGVIDLCFLESDGWVIVDYKTDDISESDIVNATRHYISQLRVYRDFWETIVGQTVSELGLFFTKLNHYQAELN